MVNEVGSISIVGTIDVSSIKAGLSQIKHGLGEAKSSAKMALGDVSLLSGAFGTLGSALVGIGVSAAAATIGLAAMGPATAPSLARMQRSFFEMTRTVSDALAPAFEGFAELMQGFSDWLASPDGKALLEGFNDVLVAIIGSLEKITTPAGEALKALQDLGGMAVGAGSGLIDALPFLDSGTKEGFKSGVGDFFTPGGVTSYAMDRLAWPVEALADGLTGLVDLLKGDLQGGSSKILESSSNISSFGHGYLFYPFIEESLNSLFGQKYKHLGD